MIEKNGEDVTKLKEVFNFEAKNEDLMISDSWFKRMLDSNECMTELSNLKLKIKESTDRMKPDLYLSIENREFSEWTLIQKVETPEKVRTLCINTNEGCEPAILIVSNKAEIY